MLLYKTYTIGKGGWSTLLGGFYNHVCGTHISPNPGPIWSPFVRFFLGEDHHLWLTVNFCLLFSAPFGYFRVFRGKLINRFLKRWQRAAEDESFVVAVCMFIYIGPPQESEDMPNANTSQVFANKNINYFVCFNGLHIYNLRV